MSFEGNSEHLALLQDGVERWNAWRKANPNIRPNLSGAILHRIALPGVNFSQSDLSRADFRGASLANSSLHFSNLHEANFDEADLSHSYMRGADLSNASLRITDLGGITMPNAILVSSNLEAAALGGSNLKNADLSGANLKDAQLNEVNLSGSIFRNANLTSCLFSETFITDVDFSDAQGLSSCIHERCSFIDHLTLTKSPQLPIEFLQGVCLSEKLIQDYLFGTSITVVFTQEGWSDLGLVRLALKNMIGEGFKVESSDDRIVVRLKSQELLNRALDVIGAVFCSLESLSPGGVSQLGIESRGIDPEYVTGEDLSFYWTNLGVRWRSPLAHNTFKSATVSGLLESLDFIPLGPLLRNYLLYFTEKVRSPDEEEERLRRIHARLLPALEALIGVRTLPKRTQNLPPTTMEK
ncbi:MAG: pentapeptide repeat-containing protein [Rhodothermales bacterium]|nr:pentapeptide repeat-containing protein [Rhodothermales bacterium]